VVHRVRYRPRSAASPLAGAISTFRAAPGQQTRRGISSGPVWPALLRRVPAGTGSEASPPPAPSRNTGRDKISSGSQPTDVASGGNNALWFTEGPATAAMPSAASAGLNAPGAGRAWRSTHRRPWGRVGSGGGARRLGSNCCRPGASALTPAVAAGIEGSAEAREPPGQELVRPTLPGAGSREMEEELGFVKRTPRAAMTEEQLLGQILSGTEFFQRGTELDRRQQCHTPTSCQALYQLLLGRSGGPAEVAGWGQRLAEQHADAGRRWRAASSSSQEYRGDVVAGLLTSACCKPHGWAPWRAALGSTPGSTNSTSALASSRLVRHFRA